MTDIGVYDTSERGDFSGQDVRLYRFTLGPVEWAYTNNDRDVVYAGRTYLAIPISDAGLKQKGDATTDDFVVTVAGSLPLVILFRGTPPSLPVRAEMRQLQMGGVDAPLMWMGYVSSVKYKDEVSATITCNTQTATLRRKGLRLAWERQCPHALYDSQCRVVQADWAMQAIITALSGTYFAVILPVGAVAANGTAMTLDRFRNGFIEWTAPLGYTERRAIQDLFEGGFLVIGQTDGLGVNLPILMYPGCNRVPASCRLFNNIPNYGGFAFLPGVSPFDGDPVF